jgi:hypothetical protein
MRERERKGRGGKLARSETVTVRLDPKLRYLAELGARKQRRTLSSFIEWAIEDSLSRVHLYEGSDNGDHSLSVADEKSNLWDVDEADRFVKLALAYEYMLTHEEQVLWKLIRETGFVWKGNHDLNGRWKWQVNKDSLVWGRLRKHWEDFNKVARGEAGRDILPKTTVKPPKSSPTKPPESDDDDIPF